VYCVSYGLPITYNYCIFFFFTVYNTSNLITRYRFLKSHYTHTHKRYALVNPIVRVRRVTYREDRNILQPFCFQLQIDIIVYTHTSTYKAGNVYVIFIRVPPKLILYNYRPRHRIFVYAHNIRRGTSKTYARFIDMNNY